MGECILNRLGRGRFKAYSAGSFPKGHIHPMARDTLVRNSYRIDGLRSKSWDEFSDDNAPALDFVFTVCDNAAREVCPVWPGQPMSAHWGLPDPAAAAGSEAEKRIAFGEALGMLTRRIEIFVSLPMHAIDKLSLQKQLDQIGTTQN